ncbi:hypothetical protein [Acetobacterium wieringae]|nr:hypothetical protein [Acetobacterium wieringae]MEA4807429.1 hypothetical protein [Acetobacterium wieringae]
MENKELFESMEGYEYFKSQLDEIPEDQREAYAATLITLIVNGFLF